MPPRERPPSHLTLAERADRHVLYQKTVQRPLNEIRFLEETFRTLRGRPPRTMREDFCGTAAMACEWARQWRDNVAVGVDLDREILDWGRAHNLSRLEPDARRRTSLICADVLSVVTAPVDLVIALNFSYWVFKDRAVMRTYFERVREALVPDGLLVLDAFGGYDAFRHLRERRKYAKYTYVWNQVDYDPISGDLLCRIDFTFPDGSELKGAFAYDWRLWTLPELRELLVEAGFAMPLVYWEGWSERRGRRTGTFSRAEKGEANAGWVCYLMAPK